MNAGRSMSTGRRSSSVCNAAGGFGHYDRSTRSQSCSSSRIGLHNIFRTATSIDGLLQNYDVYPGWIGETGTMPPQSLLGADRLVLPELLVEIEATAGS